MIVERPSWHGQAACRGDDRWLDDRRGAGLRALRQVCRACPTAGDCLREALELTPLMRHNGVLRCGIVGLHAWRYVEAIVAELGPYTAADWSAVASWLLDGDLAELDPPPVERCHPATRPVSVAPPTVGRFPTLWHYDVKLAGQTFTRAEIVALRT